MRWVPNVFWMAKNTLYVLMRRMESLESQLLNLPVNLLILNGKKSKYMSHRISWSEGRLFESVGNSYETLKLCQRWISHELFMLMLCLMVLPYLLKKANHMINHAEKLKKKKSFLKDGCFICLKLFASLFTNESFFSLNW